MGWPLMLVALCGLVLALRRGGTPAVRWLAICALLLYLTAELSSIKREPDTERYVLPCVPILAIMAGGAMAYWRPARFGRWRVPVRLWSLLPWPILLFSLTHSALISHAIGNDTRRQATQWLHKHGPRQRYTVFVQYLHVLLSSFPGIAPCQADRV